MKKNFSVKISVLGLFVSLFLLSSCSEYQLHPGQEAQGTSALDENDEFEDKLETEKFTLPNGMTFILVRNGNLPLFSYQMFVNVGGLNETVNLSGSAHFLEHLLFRGGEKFGAGEFDHTLEKMGGNSNAYTSHDRTVYYEAAPVQALPKVLEMEADRLKKLGVSNDAFEKERQVILEERKQSYENSPQGKLMTATFYELFYGTPYGNSVIGDEKILKKVSLEEIRGFFQTYYAPNNLVVVIAGDIHFSSLKSMIRRYFGGLEKSEGMMAQLENDHRKNRFYYKKSIGQTRHLYGQSENLMFSYAFRGFQRSTKENYQADLLAAILGDNQSSYLQQEFVVGRNPMLLNLSVYNHGMNHLGMFAVSGTLLKGASWRNFDRKIKSTFQKMCSKVITEREVEKAKNNLMMEYYALHQTNHGVASFIGEMEITHGNYLEYKKEIEKYNDVKAEDLKSLCRKIFSKSPNTVTIWNKNKDRFQF